MITPIRETQIHASFCRLYYKLKHQSIPILEQMLTNLQMIRNRRMLWSPDIVALNKRISDLSSQNQTLAFLKQQGLVDPDIFIAKTKASSASRILRSGPFPASVASCRMKNTAVMC